MLNFSLAMMLGFFVSGFLFSAFAAQKSIQLFKLSEYRCDQSLDGWLLSEKLDGVRAYWDGQQLWTKNGNPIYAPEWFIKDFVVVK
jgi:DNA ligase-1